MSDEPADDAVIFDVECYPDFFHATFLSRTNGALSVIQLEAIGPDATLPQADRDYLADTLANADRLVSFGGSRYDLHMLTQAWLGKTTDELHRVSTGIVLGTEPQRPNYLRNKPARHVDTAQIVVGHLSLKQCAALMHQPDISELPYDPMQPVSGDQTKLDRLREYCEVDCHNTMALYDACREKVRLRDTLNKMYPDIGRKENGGFMTALESQIGERLIASRCGVSAFRDTPKAGTSASNKAIKYRAPPYLRLVTEDTQEMLARYEEGPILADTHNIILPPVLEMKAKEVMVGDAMYAMSSGGLHSVKNGPVFRQAEPGTCEIREYDVVSYYPSILLNHGCEPVNGFGAVYQDIVDRRVEAKQRGDKDTANSMKIAINGVFGKLFQNQSILYDPETFLDVTVSGQFALLMLIEQVQGAGAEVLWANTDGIVVQVDPSQCDLDNGAVRDWQAETGFNLERTDYCVFGARDVHNYLGVTTDGEIKAKGVYASAHSNLLRKQPHMEICAEATRRLVAYGEPIDQTVRNCTDLSQFLLVKKAAVGVETQTGERLGKVVRYYQALPTNRDAGLYRVGVDGARTGVMDHGRYAVPVTYLDTNAPIPDDLDRDWYIDKACDLAMSLGDIRADRFRPHGTEDLFVAAERANGGLSR